MIRRRDDRELEKMHQANAIVLRTLEVLKRALEPGMTTAELDRIAATEIAREGAKAAFKGYRGFPASLCVSVNDEVVHGIPSPKRQLDEGDIVSLDLGAIVDGYYGDNAITAAVGEISPELENLLWVAEAAMYKGIDAAKAGNRISDIGHAVSTYVERHGFSVVREFVGHGIGRALHEDPQVPNFGEPGRGPLLRVGMVLALEPMVTMGHWEVRVLDDRWTAVTADGSLAAHFEHTVAVAEEGPEVLTGDAREAA